MGRVPGRVDEHRVQLLRLVPLVAALRVQGAAGEERDATDDQEQEAGAGAARRGDGSGAGAVRGGHASTVHRAAVAAHPGAPGSVSRVNPGTPTREPCQHRWMSPALAADQVGYDDPRSLAGEVVVGSLGLLVLGLVAYGATLDFHVGNLHNALLALTFAGVGLYVLWARPGQRMGLLFVLLGVADAAMYFGRQAGHAQPGPPGRSVARLGVDLARAAGHGGRRRRHHGLPDGRAPVVAVARRVAHDGRGRVPDRPRVGTVADRGRLEPQPPRVPLRPRRR